MILRAVVALVRSVATLVALVSVGGGAGSLLLATAGPPRLPERLPTETEIWLALQWGVDNSVLLYLAGQLGWLVLGYLGVVIVVDALLTLAETIAAGAASVRSLRHAANGLAPATVRSALSNVLLALFALRVALGTATVEARAASAPLSVVQVAVPDAGPALQSVAAIDGLSALRPVVTPATPSSADGHPAHATTRHSVAAGETLSHLALRYYGDATAWRPIWEANRGQMMPTGRTFDHYGLLLPGDLLTIPRQANARPTPLITHTVQPGETLSQISRHYHGSSDHVDEIFGDNRGAAAPHGHYLRDRNEIWPGMTLLIRQPATPTPTISPAPAPTPPPTTPVATPTASPAPAAVITAPSPSSRDAQPPTIIDSGSEAPWPSAIETPPAPMLPQPPSEAPTGAEPAPAIDEASMVGTSPSRGDQAPLTPVPASAPVPMVADLPADTATAPLNDHDESPDASRAALIAGALLAAATTASVAYRRRRRLAQSPVAVDDHRRRPFHVIVRSALDRLTGFAHRPLADQARQRLVAGIETDARAVPTGRLLTELSLLGWPEAIIISLFEHPHYLDYCLRLGRPAHPAAIDQSLEQLLGALSAQLAVTVEGEPLAGGALRLRLPMTSAAGHWITDTALPGAPLLHIGHLHDGLLSVSPEGIGSGLLLAGEGALTALESAVLSLVALYPADRLKLILLAQSPIADALAGLPHLVQAPVAADSMAARELLQALHTELRHRQTTLSSEQPSLLLLATDRPDALNTPELRDLLIDGPAYGLYCLLATADAGALESSLTGLCHGRLIGRLDDHELSRSLAGQPGAEALAAGTAWWSLPDRAPELVALLAVEPADRLALLTALASNQPTLTDTSLETAINRWRDDQWLAVDVDHGDDLDHQPAIGTPPLYHGSPPASLMPVDEIVTELELPTDDLDLDTPPERELDADADDRSESAANSAEPAEMIDGDGDEAAEVAPEGASLAQVIAPVDADSAITGDSTITAAASETPVVARPPAPSPAGSERPVVISAAIESRSSTSIRLRRDPDSTAEPERSALAGHPALQLTPPAGCLEIRLFGQPRVGHHDDLKPISRPKVAELLAYLLLHPAGASKEEIGAQLWPDADDCDRQIESLYKTKDRLAKTLAGLLPASAEPPITGRYPLNSPYRLQIPNVWSDLTALTTALEYTHQLPDETAALEVIRAALPLYQGRLCSGGSSSWLEATNDMIAGQIGRAIIWTAAVEARAGRYAVAAKLYKTLRGLSVFLDSETIFQDEMACYAQMKDYTGLQRVYREYCTWLNREYAAKPEPATVALYQHFLNRASGTSVDLSRHFVAARP